MVASIKFCEISIWGELSLASFLSSLFYLMTHRHWTRALWLSAEDCLHWLNEAVKIEIDFVTIGSQCAK